MDYVFLLDISGSMARDQKLAISHQSVVAFIDSLGPEDRFECLAFNLAPTPLFRSLRNADTANLRAAKEFFVAQRARGGTVLQPAISAAYAYRDDDRPLNVVLLSDGMTEVSEQAELLRLIQARPAGARVFCIGVGNEVNRPLLNQMASEAGGLAAFVSTEDSFRRQAQLMRQKLVRPAIENVSVEFRDGAIHDVEPRKLGDLFYGTPLRLLGRYGSSGQVAVTLTGTVQGGPWKQTVKLNLPEQDEGNSEIERMWAYQRVQQLLANERAGTASERDEIVRLCEAYSIVSPYASMLVLENNDEYKRWKIEQRNATRIERDRQSRSSIQQKLADLRRRGSEAFEIERAEKLTSTSTDPQPPSPSNANPTLGPSTASSPSVPQQAEAPPQSNRGADLDVGFSGGGGGAVDPLTALVALGTAGGAAIAGRRRKRVK
jgi:hypothetical protein